MTQMFTPQGDRIGVTVVHVGNCFVIGKRTIEKDGYSAVQVGYGEKPLRLCNKAELGLYSKLGIKPVRLVREFRLEPKLVETLEVGKPVAPSVIFKPLTFVDVCGQSKGKGFQGVIKRHHMRASVDSHGSHEFFRHGGSIGCRLTPGRVHKGKRMTGHMGDDRVTVESIALIEVKDTEGLLVLRGSVPGGNNGYLTIRNSVKLPGKAVRLTEAEQDQKKRSAGAKKPAAAAKKK
jgi:large subunit ribosomal protein L3